MIVVDASVVVASIIDHHRDGDRARQRLGGERLVAPGILDLEVLSVIRKRVHSGDLDRDGAQLALDGFVDMGIHRVRHERLLGRVWELEANVTPYDAAYVALAEAMGSVLVTADRKLAGAPGVRCRIEMLA